VGTTPESIHVVETMAMNTSIGTAGIICVELRQKPSFIPLRDKLPLHAASNTASIAAVSKAQGLRTDMASAPTKATTAASDTSNNTIGAAEMPNEGTFTVLSGILNLFNAMCIK
jgi:hypothetical protein